MERYVAQEGEVDKAKYIDWEIARRNHKVKENLATFEELVFAAIRKASGLSLEDEVLIYAEYAAGIEPPPRLKQAIDEYMHDKPRTVLPPGFSKRR